MDGQMQQLTGKPEVDIENLYDQYIALRRELEDLLYHLDSDNIREINAEIVNVFNLNADNIVAGTIDAEVINVVNINADNITAGTLTGITVQTGTYNKNRIVLNKNGIRSYNSDNQLQGLYITPGLSSLLLYDKDVSYFEIVKPTTGTFIYSMGHQIFTISSTITYPSGDWDFGIADVTGLEDSGYAKQFDISDAIAQHVNDYH
jgi:hypothetical protein